MSGIRLAIPYIIALLTDIGRTGNTVKTTCGQLLITADFCRQWLDEVPEIRNALERFEAASLDIRTHLKDDERWKEINASASDLATTLKRYAEQHKIIPEDTSHQTRSSIEDLHSVNTVPDVSLLERLANMLV